MIFITLLVFVTFSIASTAAFFSVYGLAQVFSGTFYAVILMGSALEAGKLISASFLYRYWKVISIPIKAYLCTAVFILMVITSIGVFGFLTKSYLQDTASFNDVSYTLETLQREQQLLLAERDKIEDFRNKSTENVIDNTSKRWQATTNGKLRKEYETKYEHLTAKIQQNDNEVRALRNKVSETQAHVGPIVYIAKAFGATIDDATKYMVLLLISVFDPLAVVLTIGCNIALSERKKQQDGERTITPLEDIPKELIQPDITEDTIIDDEPIIETIEIVEDIEPVIESIEIDEDVEIVQVDKTIGMDQLITTVPVAEIEEPIKEEVENHVNQLDLSNVEQSSITLPDYTTLVTYRVVEEPSVSRKDIVDFVRKN